MNIFVTGVNAVQCGHRPKMDYISFVVALTKSLTKSGHTVDIGPTTLGQNFDKYDKVVVFLATMRGFVCTQTLGALWAIHSAKGKLVLSFDDWQVPGAILGIKNFNKERDKILAENPFGYKQIENVEPVKSALFESADMLCSDNWDVPVLIPVYPGGDLSVFGIPSKKLHGFNPSVFFKGVYGDIEPNLTSKKKEWVLAALHDHSSWLKKQKLTWQVNKFGHRKQGQERIAESQLFSKYSENVGVLSPRYRIDGSGWWRARYGLAADAGCVIAGSANEMPQTYGEAYKMSASDIEGLVDDDIISLARYQKHQYYEIAGTEAEAAKKLEEILCAS